MQELVSIAMTTYNGEKYLREQLDSIFNQTYANIEIIVCDDKSSDETVRILQEYAEKFRLQYYVNEKNLGYVKNFEKAISLCQGDYIALADQDDVWLSDKIELLLKNINNNLLIHSDCSLIDENSNLLAREWKGKILSHNNFNDFLYSNVVTGCTVMFSKKLLNDILPFPDGLVYHDWYLAILAAKANKICYIPNKLIKYRQHPNQDTGAIAPNKYLSLILNPLKRLLNIKTRRYIGMHKHFYNLLALNNSRIQVAIREQQALDEAILYFEDYLNNYIHLKMFFIGCKYGKHKYRYKNNYFYIQNILRELLG